MALARTVRSLISNAGNNATTTAVGSAFTPAAGSLLILPVAQGQQNGTVRNHTISDTFGDTGGTAWALVDPTTGTNAGGNWFLRQSFWYRKIGTGPGSGAITITRNDATSQFWFLKGIPVEITGYDTTTPIRQVISGSNTASTYTLNFGSNFVSGNYVFGGIVSDTDAAITPGANYTEIADSYDSGFDSVFQAQEWLAPTATTAINWSGLGTVANRAVAIEVAAAAGGDVNVNLTGQGVTGATGTLGTSRDFGLAGSAVAISTGTLGIAITSAITGSALTGVTGTLTQSISIVLSGEPIAAAIGMLTPSLLLGLTGELGTFSTGTITIAGGGDVTLALTGSALGITPGTLGVSFTVPITGSLVAASPGNLAPGTSVSVSGTLVNFAVGSLLPSTVIPVLGERANFASGVITPSGGTPVVGGAANNTGFILNVGSLMTRR